MQPSVKSEINILYTARKTLRALIEGFSDHQQSILL